MNNTKMTCPLQTDNADVLLDYCARVLDPERKEMLELHMAQCADCREMAEAQSHIWSAMDLYDAEPISADFDGSGVGAVLGAGARVLAGAAGVEAGAIDCGGVGGVGAGVPGAQ
jgi:hypothetical protein